MDNFAVGASLGISNKELKQSTNAIIQSSMPRVPISRQLGDTFWENLPQHLPYSLLEWYLHILPLMNSFHGDDAIRSLPLQ